jgi:hypothetical protein
MFTTSLRGKDENVREGKGNWDWNCLLELSAVVNTLYTT